LTNQLVDKLPVNLPIII